MAGVLRLQKGVKGGAFIQDGDMSRMNDVMRDMLSLGAISVARAFRGANSDSRPRRPAGLRARAAGRLSGPGSKYRADGNRHTRRPAARPGRMLAGVLQAAGGGDREQGHGHDHGFGHRNSYALRLRQGRFKRRLDAAARGKASTVSVCVAHAGRFCGRAPDAGSIWNPSSGCWSRIRARCRFTLR